MFFLNFFYNSERRWFKTRGVEMVFVKKAGVSLYKLVQGLVILNEYVSSS